MNIYIAISIIFLILIIIYFFARKGARIHNVIEEDVIFLVDKETKSYNNDLLPESMDGEKYTFSFWIYTNNLPENVNWGSAYIRPKGVISHYNSPNVYFLPDKDILRISIGYKNDFNELEKYEFDIETFKYQRWENVAIVVDNRFVDIYLNGEMIKSMYLPNVPWVSNKMLHLGQNGNNFNGHLTQIEYINDSFSATEVHSLYKKNRSSVLSKKVMNYSEYKNKNKIY
jgi:hypothetical protein